MKRFYFSAPFAFALCSAVNPIVAQTAIDTAKIYTLGEVHISASRIAQEVIPAQTLSGEELQRLSAHSVADAVRYFSGVQIKDYGGIGGLKTVNIRSMGSQQVGVFYDGIELGNAQNGTIDLGRFSLENMESISLYNGQKSAIFQSAKDLASAGSIYMVTRTPSFDGGKKTNIHIKLKGGSFGTLNPALLWEQQVSKNITSSFNAEYMYTTGKYKFSYKKKEGYDTTEVRKNGDVYALRLEQGWFGKIKNGEWKAKAYYYNSERGYPGAAVREEPGKFKHQDRQWDSNFFVQASLRQRFGQRYDLLMNAKYAYDYLHYQSDPRWDVTTMYINNRYKQQEAYLSSANRIHLFDWWSVNLSADFQYNALRADLIDFVYPKRYTGLVAAATSLHLDRFKLQASMLATFVHETTRTTDAAADDKQRFTPTVAASWQPWPSADIHLRAFYKKIFRMPTFNDLYYTFIGNKTLKPEYTTQYNIGAVFAKTVNSKRMKRIEVQIDAYYNEVTDKIITIPTSNQFLWTTINLDMEIRGVDVAIVNMWQVARHWTVRSRINYTHQKAHSFVHSTASNTRGRVPYIPANSGSLVLGSSYKTWDFNYSFIYTGERYNSSAEIPENYEKPWYTSDISVSKTFRWRHKKIRLTAEVNNLFNQQYEVVQCYPMPGTNLFFSLNIHI